MQRDLVQLLWSRRDRQAVARRAVDNCCSEIRQMALLFVFFSYRLRTVSVLKAVF